MLHRVSLLLVLALGLLPAQIQSLTLFPAKDNTLYEDPAGALSNGRGSGIFAGVTFGNVTRRALVQFDVASALPAGAKILTAELQFECTITVVGAIPITVHRVLNDWGEGQSQAPGQGGQGFPAAPGDATWLHRFYPNTLWTRAGGDFDLEPSAVFAVDQPDYYQVATNSDLIADVQRFLDTPSQNFGWLLLADENQFSAKRFGSRESTIPGRRPELRLTYTLDPAGSVTTSPAGCTTPLAFTSLRLTTNHLPRLGDAGFAFQLREATPATAVDFYLASGISGSNPAGSIMGCPIYLDLASALVFLQAGTSPLSGLIAGADGRIAVPLPLPFDPSLIGFTFAVQALEIDAGGNLTTSNALAVTLQ